MVINLPNLFTLARLVLTPFIAAGILHGSYGRAIVLFFLAGVSDAVDGYLARRLHESTPAGAYFDPLADKILLSVIYISLAAAGAIPWWIAAFVLARDLLILLMAAYALLFTSLRRFPPSLWGKVSTLLQIAAALAVMSARAGLQAPVQAVVWLMLVGTFASGFYYTSRGIRLLRTKVN